MLPGLGTLGFFGGSLFVTRGFDVVAVVEIALAVDNMLVKSVVSAVVALFIGLIVVGIKTVVMFIVSGVDVTLLEEVVESLTAKIKIISAKFQSRKQQQPKNCVK